MLAGPATDETEWSASRAATRAAPTCRSPTAGRAAAATSRRCSPATTSRSCSRVRRSRARETARLAGFPDAEVGSGPAGVGLRRLRRPHHRRDPRARSRVGATGRSGRGPLPGGESDRRRSRHRAEPVIARADAAAGDVLLFGHGHQLRDPRRGRARSRSARRARASRSIRRRCRSSATSTRRALRVWNRAREA